MIVGVKISERGNRDEEIAIINGPMFLDPPRIKLTYHDRRYACRHALYAYVPADIHHNGIMRNRDYESARFLIFAGTRAD